MKTHLPVSEAEDTAAILCVEPLAFSFSATRLLLLLASTVNTSPRFFRKQWNSRGLQKPGSNASLQPTFYCRATLYRWLPQPPLLSSYLPSHSTSPHLFYNLTHTPSLLITVPPPAFPTVAPYLFFCAYLPADAEKRDCATEKEKSSPAAAASEGCLVIF